MKENKIHFTVILLSAICVLLFAACDWETEESKSFAYELHGTWVTNDPDSLYNGMLVITYDRIAITGYGESQTPRRDGNDAQRPFRNFTKGTPLLGYSEEGRFFITDAGIIQEGVPYIYWEDDLPPNFTKVKFLRFEFGGRVETLKLSSPPAGFFSLLAGGGLL